MSIADVPPRIDVEALCAQKGLRITEQRRVIARVIGDSVDHPDVETLHARSAAIDPGISIATVYRTVRLLEEAGVLDKHDFGDGRSRYEASGEVHHDHLIDIESGRVIEFNDADLEALQRVIAQRLGYRLVDHRMELYAVPIQRDASVTPRPVDQAEAAVDAVHVGGATHVLGDTQRDADPRPELPHGVPADGTPKGR